MEGGGQVPLRMIPLLHGGRDLSQNLASKISPWFREILLPLHNLKCLNSLSFDLGI